MTCYCQDECDKPIYMTLMNHTRIDKLCPGSNVVHCDLITWTFINLNDTSLNCTMIHPGCTDFCYSKLLYIVNANSFNIGDIYPIEFYDIDRNIVCNNSSKVDLCWLSPIFTNDVINIKAINSFTLSIIGLICIILIH